MSLLPVAQEQLRVASRWESSWKPLYDGLAPPIPGAQALECKIGYVEALRKVSSLPLDLTTSWKTCNIGEGCQETLLLILNGEKRASV